MEALAVGSVRDKTCSHLNGKSRLPLPDHWIKHLSQLEFRNVEH